MGKGGDRCFVPPAPPDGVEGDAGAGRGRGFPSRNPWKRRGWGGRGVVPGANREADRGGGGGGGPVPVPPWGSARRRLGRWG